MRAEEVERGTAAGPHLTRAPHTRRPPYTTDGGMQEFNAAKSAVLAACPDADVQKVCKDEYPVR